MALPALAAASQLWGPAAAAAAKGLAWPLATLAGTLALSPLGEAAAEAYTGEKAAGRAAEEKSRKEGKKSRKEMMAYLREQEGRATKEERRKEGREERLLLQERAMGEAGAGIERYVNLLSRTGDPGASDLAGLGAVESARGRSADSLAMAQMELKRRIGEGMAANPFLVAGVNFG